MPRKIELLSPARDADCGIEAIRHGADAVYIGGPAFGARAAATNSLADIARLCDEAHLFSARVYVTLNTILWEDELKAAEKLVSELYRVGVDALIVQDLGLLRLDLPPIALHASTQMDNRTADKVQWLESLGFSQVVLARELSISQIAAIHQATSVPLEAFVHGALCVSYSGQCYASQYCFQRSANRGCCAQFCRLAFDLLDADGNVVVHDRHLLSLRDMNRSHDLEEMMDAGVSSFKIEGRLKDVSYVKNVTAYYRRQLDRILERRSADFVRASCGTSNYDFVPQLGKSFNRGFTEYYLHGRKGDEFNFNTPKATGEFVGTVRQVRQHSFTFSAHKDLKLNAGDGICYFNAQGELSGFRVNKVEGNEVFPYPAVRLLAGTKLFRNSDAAFEKLLARPSAVRKLQVHVTLRETESGYELTLRDESGQSATARLEVEKAVAQKPQAAYIRQQLAKLGGSPFFAGEVEIVTEGERFIPASQLSELRRKACEALVAAHRQHYAPERRQAPHAFAGDVRLPHDYRANVANSKAAAVYHSAGVNDLQPAYEIQAPSGAVIMFCRHCLRYALDACPRHGGTRKLREPLSLRLPDGRMFPLKFDCKNCQMLVYAPTSH